MMRFRTKAEIMEVLRMPEEQFQKEILPLAEAALKEQKGNKVQLRSMLGYSNICRCSCLYCGMRGGNKLPKRYRLSVEEILSAAEMAKKNGFHRIFLISGEDFGFGFEKLHTVVKALHGMGLFISLACGEFSEEQYQALAEAGADEYVIKFEMSNPAVFNNLNPSTFYERRRKSIEAVQKSGMLLGSGNIVDYPNHDIDDLAEDILLMQALNISWAPIIPYMPAMGTPLAEEGGRGSLLTLHKEIALLRLSIPGVDITAQQPGPDPKSPLGDTQGCLDAVRAGANVLFFDLLPDTLSKNFRVVDQRDLTNIAHPFEAAKKGGFELDL